MGRGDIAKRISFVDSADKVGNDSVGRRDVVLDACSQTGRDALEDGIYLSKSAEGKQDNNASTYLLHCSDQNSKSATYDELQEAEKGGAVEVDDEIDDCLHDGQR